MTAPTPLIPPRDKVKLCFAHEHYAIRPAFEALMPDVACTEVTTRDALPTALAGADVLVTSGFWRNALLDQAPQLKFVQSISSGTNQYDADAFRKHGVILCGGAGVNMTAVAEHAMALILSLTRRIVHARDNQHRAHWPAPHRDPAAREIELPGRTILIVGMGKIGNRIATLAKAFGMRVIGLRRSVAAGRGNADEIHPFSALPELIPQADIVLLSCPLSDETRNIIGARELARFRPDAYFINVARGPCVDEAALIEALRKGVIAGAGLDVTMVEPLPATSPLWSMENVILTPHFAGETRLFERNLAAILSENLERLWRGETELLNRVV